MDPNLSDIMDSVEVSIRRVENGFLVHVYTPPRLLPPRINPATEAFTKLFQSKGDIEMLDPEKIMGIFGDALKKTQEKPPKPLRRLHEEYIFSTLDSVMKFVEEELGSSRE